MSTPNAEDLVVDFENQSGDKFQVHYDKRHKAWLIDEIEDICGDNYVIVFSIRFKNLREAEACAEALKKSV